MKKCRQKQEGLMENRRAFLGKLATLAVSGLATRRSVYAATPAADFETLHRDSIVIDAVCPLLQDRQYMDWYRQGGATAVGPTIASGESAGANPKNEETYFPGAYLPLVSIFCAVPVLPETE